LLQGLSPLLSDVLDLNKAVLICLLEVELFPFLVNGRLHHYLCLSHFLFVDCFLERLLLELVERGSCAPVVQLDLVSILVNLDLSRCSLRWLLVDFLNSRRLEQLAELLLIVLLPVGLVGRVVVLYSLSVQVHQVVDVVHGDVATPFFALHLQLQDTAREVCWQALRLVLHLHGLYFTFDRTSVSL
jgi:hypothetical protein